MRKIAKNGMILVLLVAALLPLSANAQKETTDTIEPVEIQFWTRQTQSERQEKIQVILDVFQILNPDIKVTMLPVEDNEFSAQLAAAGQANRPSLIETSPSFAMSYSNENIVDSASNAQVIKSIGQDVFYPGSLNNVKMNDGTYFGIPFHFSAQGFWYRADWFKEAGLEPPNTWDNLLKAAEYFNDPKNKQYGILIGTKPENYTQQVFTHLATSNGAHLFDADGNLNISSPEFKETVEFYKELSKFNPPGPQNWRARDYYIQGKMAMFYYSTYIMDDLSLAEVASASLTGENFADLSGGAEFDENLVKNTAFSPLITNTEPSAYGEIMTLSILKSEDARKAEAARRLAEFFLSDENYIPYLHVAPGGMLAMKTSVLESDAFLADPNNVYTNYGKEKILEIASGLGNMQDFLNKDGKVYPESATILAKNILAEMLYNITIEDKDIDDEIAAAEKEMARAINN
ncbi:MAG: extracellular solute-binding protein [Spirochaetia bacterium]|nr:extracellular solute-binding protein [Spirochaetia bacterium]